MIFIHTPAEIEQMRPAGAFVRDTLATLSKMVAVGVNLLEIEDAARAAIAERGAVSCYWDYAPSFGNGPFRNVICLSVNDAAQHGLPHDYRLRDGDVLSLDLAASVDGWVADAAATVIAGRPDPDDERLIRSTQEALAAGIAAAQPDNRVGDISAAIGAVAAEYGYPVNHEFGGHGVGRSMHEDLFICNDGRPGRGYRRHDERLVVRHCQNVRAAFDHLHVDEPRCGVRLDGHSAALTRRSGGASPRPPKCVLAPRISVKTDNGLHQYANRWLADFADLGIKDAARPKILKGNAARILNFV